MSGNAAIGAPGRLVDPRRIFHVQGLLGTMLKSLDKLIEAGLRLQEIRGRRLGGLFLQGQVHALMAAVLLGDARAWMRSIPIPRRSHHTDNLLRLNSCHLAGR